MNFDLLREANVSRQKEWPGNEKADIPFRMIEVSGESGELAEAVKKWLRSERGIHGNGGDTSQIADEMADVIIAVDLLAEMFDINLDKAVRNKFNKTSTKYGLTTMFW
tara:strand:+ start:106 stop:429 length:324 start_codon:yes stop_codon:yes gene_type:complete